MRKGSSDTWKLNTERRDKETRRKMIIFNQGQKDPDRVISILEDTPIYL